MCAGEGDVTTVGDGGGDPPVAPEGALPRLGARPVHLIITMIEWMRTSRLSIKNSLSLQVKVTQWAMAAGTPPWLQQALFLMSEVPMWVGVSYERGTHVGGCFL